MELIDCIKTFTMLQFYNITIYPELCIYIHCELYKS